MDMTCATFEPDFSTSVVYIQIQLAKDLKTKLTINPLKTGELDSTQAFRMNRSPNGLSTKDPFFERMMDERIATLRAFLRMTTEKYQVPEAQASPDSDVETDQRLPVASNVIELRRKS